jgi:glutathione-independent formaldehyde dehydrogenase
MFGAGSVVAALRLGGGELDYAGLDMVAITFGLAIALAIYAFGNTSGAHLNPAVTVSLAAVGRFPWADAPAYIGAQLVGGLVGAALIVSAFGGDAVDLGMGQTSIADGSNYIQAIVAEAIATFLLVTAIMALAVDKRAPGGWAGLTIGLAVTRRSWWSAPSRAGRSTRRAPSGHWSSARSEAGTPSGVTCRPTSSGRCSAAPPRRSRSTRSPARAYSSSNWRRGPRASSRAAATSRSSRRQPQRQRRERRDMAENRGVAYMGPGEVELHDIDFPTFELQDGPGVNPANVGRQLPHAAILRIVATNICGSDQHMVRGRTTAPEGLILGHEITGEVIETGPGVEFIKEGDLCSVPFNIACGRCRMCKTGNTGVCLNVNPDRPGSAYGYVDMGGWVGGQAEFVAVPYADWNLLKFPDKEQAMEKILDLTMLSDIFPTGYHGCYTAGVTSGSTVYIAGAGPVGLAAAHSAQLLGAAVVIVGDMIPERLEQARSFGCETIDVSKGDPKDQIEQILGVPEVDAAVDAVGFEARGHGSDADHEAPATVLNSIMDVTRVAGRLGIPGLYVTGDPGGVDEAAKVGSLSIRIGLGWAKSHSFTTGQCPVMKYHHSLMQMILNDRAQIAKAVNATVITLDEASDGYRDFDQGAAKKFVFNPHGLIKV